MSKRELLARALSVSGATDAAMAVRGQLRLPWVPVLSFHHISDLGDDYPFDRGVVDATPRQLRTWTEQLCRWGTALTLADFVRVLNGNYRPRNPFLLSFDDGYASNRHHALPIFQALGVPATFFIASDYITQRRLFWWDRLTWCCNHAAFSQFEVPHPEGKPPFVIERGNSGCLQQLFRFVKDTPGVRLPEFLTSVTHAAGLEWDRARERVLADSLLMTWDDIRVLADAGMDIGSHTRTHRVLATVPAAELDAELRGSRLDIEAELNRPVSAIAYPVGHSIAARPDLREAVIAAGYSLGFTNASGMQRIRWGRDPDRFDLRRLATEQTMSDAAVFAQCAWPGWRRLGTG